MTSSKAKTYEYELNPILFSTPMVEAIICGLKIETRRIVKLHPHNPIDETCDPNIEVDSFANGYLNLSYGGTSLVPMRFAPVKSPYGKAGDYLWVRETWATHKSLDNVRPSEIEFNNGSWPKVWYKAGDLATGYHNQLLRGKNRPSIFMPRWASRIKLLNIDVRVERLQDIDTLGALSEGIKLMPNGNWRDYLAEDAKTSDHYENPIDSFRSLWDSINAARGVSWNDNPLVWVVEFALSSYLTITRGGK